MANDTPITIIGNLTADPELRQAGSASVVNFTIASTPRHFDRTSNDWVDDETLFLRATAWRDRAEMIAESLHKGQRVIAYGNLKQKSFETKEGEKRTSLELDVLEIGPAIPANRPNTQRAGGVRQTQAAAPPAPAQQDVWNQPDAPGATGYDPNAPF